MKMNGIVNIGKEQTLYQLHLKRESLWVLFP